ncbi:MAG TPA: hypothetical protein VH988_08210 [Thermoanaerobaculia bacterium]|nr:hypothetical protein [Thermoanaerobaculia bacterium]
MPHKSTNSKSFGEVVNHWGVLAAGLKANATDIPHLDGHRVQIETIFTQAQALLSEQKIQTASKQDLTRQIEVLLDQGTKIASFLRHGVKQHYGTRSEKLVEFDLAPFRGKTPAVKPPAPEIKPPAGGVAHAGGVVEEPKPKA